MIRLLNKYFAVLMLMFILSTSYLYKLRVSDFVNNSIEHTFILEQELSDKNKQNIEKKLKNLTYNQDVLIEEKEDAIYVKIKFPPDRLSFFSKLFCEKKWE